MRDDENIQCVDARDRDAGNIGRRVVRYTGMEEGWVKRARKSVARVERASERASVGADRRCLRRRRGEKKRRNKNTHRYSRTNERVDGQSSYRVAVLLRFPRLSRILRAAGDAVASATTPHSTRRRDVVDGVSSHRRRACGANEFFPSHRAIDRVGVAVPPARAGRRRRGRWTGGRSAPTRTDGRA